MQRLYENHKVLTYPRTDSRYLSADILPHDSGAAEGLRCGALPGAGRPAFHAGAAEKIPSFVNDKKVSDHHAIIPTEQFVDLTPYDGGRAADL